ncbi:S-adenosyl-L-methionine-dependent methyltransferase, partial [Lophium mytilinum]
NEVVMRGDGNYNKNSSLQQVAVLPALSLLPSLATHNTSVIVDYGCSQGSSSIIPLKALLATIPSGSSVELIFNDRPENDFTTLSRTIKDRETDLNRNGELLAFPSMVPVSYFNQIVPDNTVDVGMAWSTLNYLETQLPLAPTADLREMAQLRASRNVKQGHADLVKVLTLRAKESKKGGVFIAGTSARPSGEGSHIASIIIGLMMGPIGAMVAAGRMTPQNIMAMDPPAHERAIEEVQGVFEEVKELWTVESCFEKTIVHPAYEWLVEELKKDDGSGKEGLRREFATRIVDWILAAFAGFF